MPRLVGALAAFTLAVALLLGCGHDNPVRPAPSLDDPVYQRFQAFQEQIASADGSRHGVVAAEQDLAAWRLVVLANGTTRVELAGVAPGTRACWVPVDLPGVLYDDGPGGAVIQALPTDVQFSSSPVEIVRVNGVAHTPMASRDGKVFAYVMQENGNDTSFVVIHDGASIRRYPLQVGSYSTQVSMADRGDAFFYTVPYQGLFGLWLDPDGARTVSYRGQYRAALSADRRTLVFSEGFGEAIATVYGLAGCPTCTSEHYYDAAFGPNGYLYCIQDNDGTRRLLNHSTREILTTGNRSYSWPSIQ
jgi:hypothetical protein